MITSKEPPESRRPDDPSASDPPGSGSRFSLSLKSLMIVVAHFAICSWLISIQLWMLAPIYAAGVMGFQLGKHTDYIPMIVALCAATLALAILFVIFGSFLAIVSPSLQTRLPLVLLATAWVVAIAMGLLLRKMLLTRKPRRDANR